MNQRYFDFSGTSRKLPRIIIKSTIDDILTLTKKKLKKKESQLSVLDVGSGFGDYAQELTKRVKKVVGVEPYEVAYSLSLKAFGKNKKLKVFNLPVEKFKSKDKFDLAISLTTLEHMPQAEKSYKRVFELLKPGGVLYLTAPNKLWPIESHYNLPFLSMLPAVVSNAYLKLFRGINTYEDCSYTKTYFGVKKLLEKMPCKFEFIVPDPNSPYLGCGGGNNQFVQKFGIALLKRYPFFWVIAKGFIVLAVKNK